MDAIKELKEYDGYILSEQYKIRHRVIQEIKQLRLANSDLQMHYDHARTECDKLREALELVVVYWDEWMGKDGDPLALSLEEVVAAVRESLKEKE
jgi:hypothetical protein